MPKHGSIQLKSVELTNGILDVFVTDTTVNLQLGDGPDSPWLPVPIEDIDHVIDALTAARAVADSKKPGAKEGACNCIRCRACRISGKSIPIG